MGGGLMQLVAYGAQDIYLTGNPQITFFKTVYRRHTNFSMETINQTFNATVEFGKKSSCTISRNGDLIHRGYLSIDVELEGSGDEIEFGGLKDWNNNSCEGKYLKSLYERKVKKNYKYSDNKQAFRNTKSYGGFFHLEPSGMKKRHIFVMDGYGGQTLTIDFDTGRIVTTMAIHRDFNWMKIAHSVIKKGK